MAIASKPKLLHRAAGWLAHVRAVDLNTADAWRRARIAGPLLFGLYSLWLGQDRNWDQLNYHLYNAFALLHGKLGLDIAPGGMQTYFNPVLDVFPSLLYAHLPAPLVGFALGVLHGISFVLVLEIARQTLTGLSPNERYRTPLLLAVAGCLTANFLVGIGNSMGDDTTALFVLAAVALILNRWQQLRVLSARGFAYAFAAGLLAGCAAGLKLTNAVYPIAICAACFTLPGRFIARLRASFFVGLGVLAGIAATGGYWFAKMWEVFHNPVFPQFSNVFPNELVRPMAVADMRWFPTSWIETLLWPFVFSLNSKRVTELPVHQIIWALLYASLIVWLPVVLRRAQRGRKTGQAATRIDAKRAFVLVYICVGYVVWLKMFCIYRYTVPMEMLTPLALYIVLDDLLPNAAHERAAKTVALTGKRIAGVALAVASLVVVLGGAPTFGHERWAWRAFRAETPTLNEPERTTILIVGGASGSGWLATFYPPNVAFAKIDSNFPTTPLYDEKVKSLIERRGGPAFVLVEGHENWRARNVAKSDAILRQFGLLNSKSSCSTVHRVIERLHLHATVEDNADGSCHLGLRADDKRDMTPQNIAEATRIDDVLKNHGMSLQSLTCERYATYIGSEREIYQLCPLNTNFKR
ncbi:hypothetical protein [Paraburkholderia rhizosphaerae]|uniref:Dolichyl-phosphate-mannose-protein mannosyltransferase n=1 Tax=Paraburkholderia rhizosphaerae TaxID=480658 RepID=A0A4R8L4E7_9BURK|nr:hypothetical protein [Paraburkholderia rhizosphaerae]TDY37135.1 hypothetical protein BX592_1436 [Paraburkholderia rhizosphaerae]